MVSEYGNYDGTVSSVNPVSSSSGRSGVTYSVVLELTGDVSALSQNLSATVYFGVSTQDLQTQEPAAGAAAPEAAGQEATAPEAAGQEETERMTEGRQE